MLKLWWLILVDVEVLVLVCLYLLMIMFLSFLVRIIVWVILCRVSLFLMVNLFFFGRWILVEMKVIVGCWLVRKKLLVFRWVLWFFCLVFIDVMLMVVVMVDLLGFGVVIMVILKFLNLFCILLMFRCLIEKLSFEWVGLRV